MSTGSGAPGTTPAKVDDIYIDTTAPAAYIATGTASSADWDGILTDQPTHPTTSTQRGAMPAFKDYFDARTNVTTVVDADTMLVRRASDGEVVEIATSDLSTEIGGGGGGGISTVAAPSGGDDRAVIQAALDAGDVVVLQAGTYLLASKNVVTGKHSLTIPSNTTLLGQGPSLTTIKAADSLDDDTPLLWFDGSNIEIGNLTVDGNKSRAAVVATPGGEDEGIDGKSGASRIRIHDVDIHDCGQDGIDFDGVTDFTIANVQAWDNYGNGIHLSTGCERGVLTNINTKNNAHEKLAAGGAPAEDASGVDVRGYNIAISGFVSVNDARGFQVHNASEQISLTGFVIDDPGTASVPGPGIRLDAPSAGPLIDVVISSGVIRNRTSGGSGTDRTGVLCNGARGVQICDVLISTGSYGVAVTNAADDVTIMGSRIRSAATAGVYVSAAATRVVVKDSFFDINANYGYHQTAAPTAFTVDGCTFASTSAASTSAVRIEAASTGEITNNNCTNGFDFAIDLRGATTSGVYVTSNVTRASTAGAGIRLLNSPTNCVVVFNTALDGITTSGTGHTVSNNVT